MKKFQAGELVKTMGGTYAIIVGGTSYISDTEDKREKMEILPICFYRGRMEKYPRANLQKVEPITQEEQQIKEELVKRVNKYIEQKVKNKRCKK